MITINPDHIPQLKAKKRSHEDWLLECEGRVIAQGLSEYMAKMLSAAPRMLQFLSTMAKRDHAPAKLPIQNMLASQGLKFKWPHE